MGFRYKLARFMYGRNGFDRFGRFLLWSALGVWLVGLIINIVVDSPVPGLIFTLIYYSLLIYCVFRAMSRNLVKRRSEEVAYNRLAGNVKGWFALKKNKFRDRKTHIYRTCPECKANLRLPKRKGTNTVKCPRCYARFEVRS